ncbi:MAG: Lrp/AsnC family transcriptional regulator [Candidatus Thorarchaeota archaeon]
MFDEIDRDIINLLMEDSRITNIEIAKKIKRSESTVRQRVTKLLDKGIIRKFSIVVDPAALGYTTISYIGINTHPAKLLKIIQSLKKIEEIVSIATTTGDYMIVCEIWTSKGDNLSEIVDQIEAMEGILEVLPSIIQEKHKEYSINGK